MSDQTTAQDSTTGITADNIDLTALQTELENSKAKLVELTQISQQALADLQNFKKRTEEEKIKFVAFANATLISDLLPILDNIDRAMAHLPEEPSAKEWANGIMAVLKQLEEALKARGLEYIATTGQTFDPVHHEALMTEPGPKDQVIKEIEKGYKITDRVLRRAKVTVGNTPNPASDNKPETLEERLSAADSNDNLYT
jgi:molecular chaperone GrpE